MTQTKRGVPCIVERLFMFVPHERNRENKHSTRTQHAVKLCNKDVRIEHMFEHLVAQNCIEFHVPERKLGSIIEILSPLSGTVLRRVNLQSYISGTFEQLHVRLLSATHVQNTP